jgi:hypothetical protein
MCDDAAIRVRHIVGSKFSFGLLTLELAATDLSMRPSKTQDSTDAYMVEWEER